MYARTRMYLHIYIISFNIKTKSLQCHLPAKKNQNGKNSMIRCAFSLLHFILVLYWIKYWNLCFWYLRLTCVHNFSFNIRILIMNNINNRSVCNICLEKCTSENNSSTAKIATSAMIHRILRCLCNICQYEHTHTHTHQHVNPIDIVNEFDIHGYTIKLKSYLKSNNSNSSNNRRKKTDQMKRAAIIFFLLLLVFLLIQYVLYSHFKIYW